MKRIIFALPVFLFLLSACEKSSDNPSSNNGPDTIKLAMGASYANDVYYKLDSGVVATVPRNTWDIAFHISTMGATILTNDGNNVVLYAYPDGDTTAWKTISTANISSWKALYNSDTTWTLGAFERNTKGHPDYGWGVYNSSTHDVVGDSLFVIKLNGGQLKKLWIHKKYSTQNIYKITYANLDGTDSITKLIDCKPYTGKNFVYYSLTTNAVVDREPAKNKWDFVLTKYMVLIPAGPQVMAQSVTGILTNTMRLNTMGVVSYTGVRAAKLENADPSVTDFSTAQFSTSISTIGYDWKDAVSYTPPTYTVKDDRVYFIKRPDGTVFKIVFVAFDASAGVATFVEQKLN